MKNIEFRRCGMAVASLLAIGGLVATAAPASATPASASAAAAASASASASASAASAVHATSTVSSAPATTPTTPATQSTVTSTLGVTTTEYDPSVPFTIITGSSAPNALIGVTIGGRTYGARADGDGAWAVYQVVGLVGPSAEGTVFEIVGETTNRLGFTLTSSAASTAPAAPVVTTSEFDPLASSITISGTAQPAALVAVEIAGASYGGRADDQGAWSISDVAPPTGSGATGLAWQITGGQASAKTTFTLRPHGSETLAPATITTTTYSRSEQFNPVSGTGAPGALIGVTVGGKTFSARVTADGLWTVPNVTTLVASSQIATVFQVKDGLTSDTASFTLHADVPVAPVDIASPANPAVGYQPDQPFTFTGKADALADTVTVRNFAGTLVATVPVDHTTGQWSWTRSNMGTSTWKLTFISNEGNGDEEKTTLADFRPAASAPEVRPVVFTNPANPAAGYVPNTAFTFRGTASPGAKITLQNAYGTIIATGITAAADGTWSWTRANMATSIWKITAIADAGTPTEQSTTLGAFAPQR